MTECNWISRNSRNATNRRALLIGINYSGNKSLTGTVRDVKRVAYVLRKKYDFQDSDLLVLTDSQKSGIKNVEHRPATKANIIECVGTLVQNVKSGDKLVLYFAGHGEQTIDLDIGGRDREDDGLNENILPQDHAQSGYIRDDILNNLLVHKVPKDVSLTSIVDCCHSGTLLDLPFIFDRDNDGGGMTASYRKTENVGIAAKDAVRGVQQNMGKMNLRENARMFVGKMAKIAHDKRKGAQETSEIDGGNIILLSACKDNEKSLTQTQDGLAAGAMTTCLIRYILKNPEISLEDVIRRLRADLESNNQVLYCGTLVRG